MDTENRLAAAKRGRQVRKGWMVSLGLVDADYDIYNMQNG